VVGFIGNGDLQGAAQIHSLLYVMELMIVVVLAPFARFPRRIARAWLAFPLRAGGHGEARAAEARRLIGLLTEHRRLMQEAGDKPQERLGRDYFGPVGHLLTWACPPFLALLLLGQAATGFVLLFASAPVALLWRSRRYLADATAVQLTREPTGLHQALTRLGECGALAPGGEPLAHLFVVGPEAAAGREERQQREEIARLTARLRAEAEAARAAGTPAPGVLDAAARAVRLGGELVQSHQAEYARKEAARKNLFWEREGLLMGFHPPLARRLRRLVRMGAIGYTLDTRRRKDTP
jgi:hypothetical protein